MAGREEIVDHLIVDFDVAQSHLEGHLVVKLPLCNLNFIYFGEEVLHGKDEDS